MVRLAVSVTPLAPFLASSVRGLASRPRFFRRDWFRRSGDSFDTPIPASRGKDSCLDKLSVIGGEVPAFKGEETKLGARNLRILILLASALLLSAAWVKRDSLGWPSWDSDEKMCSEVDIDLPAPQAVFRDYGGNWSKLEEYKGQVVLVNFWATWCPPCEVEMPTLIQLQEEYGAKGFTVIGIAMDDEGAETVKPFVETRRFEVQGAKRAMNYPVYLGTQDMAEKFGVKEEYPSSFLVSRDGRQVKRIVGPVYHPSLSKAIKGLL